MTISYRLGSRAMFVRPNEGLSKPKHVVFLSVEGTKTEISYFNYVKKYREKLGINAMVYVEVLQRYDTKSDPENVLSLLEEYLQLRNETKFKDKIRSSRLKAYPREFIETYLNTPETLDKKVKHKFEEVLRQENLDLHYLDFLNRFQGEDDVFGVVIDRDCGSHSAKQLVKVISECKAKGYLCYLSNPCIEFWLLLHVADVAKEYAGCLKEILANKLDGKGNSFVSNLLYERTGQRKSIQEKNFIVNYLPHIDTAIARSKAFADFDSLLNELGTNVGDLFKILRATK